MPKVRSEASGLRDRMCKLETGIYTVFWNDTLGRVNATSYTLQDPKLDLNTAVALLKSLKSFVSKKTRVFLLTKDFTDWIPEKHCASEPVANFSQSEHNLVNMKA